jgi:hypothetical protein
MKTGGQGKVIVVLYYEADDPVLTNGRGLFRRISGGDTKNQKISVIIEKTTNYSLHDTSGH